MKRLLACLLAWMMIAAAAPPTGSEQSPCTTIELVADSYSIGGHRYDAPEHIRGLHARGDSTGALIHVATGGKPERSFFLWALDTKLDGVERYDAIAVSLTENVGYASEGLVELRADLPERIAVLPAGSSALTIIVPRIKAALTGLRLCVGP